MNTIEKYVGLFKEDIYSNVFPGFPKSKEEIPLFYSVIRAITKTNRKQMKQIGGLDKKMRLDVYLFFKIFLYPNLKKAVKEDLAEAFGLSEKEIKSLTDIVLIDENATKYIINNRLYENH